MKRVHFIGSGYESVKFIIVEAETNGEAFRKAEDWYNSTGQTFSYNEMEVEDFQPIDSAWEAIFAQDR